MQRLIIRLAVLICGGVAAIAVGANTPAQAAPSSARSFYVYQYDTGWAYDRGCDAGSGDASEAGTQKHYVVLDFGAMYQNSGGTWMVSAFGGTDFSMSKAREMAEHWAEGYWTCTGGDHTSVAYVGIGTNNSGGDITSAAGAHLASVVTNGNDDLHGTPNYYDQGRIMGADDFESFGFGSSHNTSSRNWMDGYNGPADTLIVNYGSADGCPSGSTPSAGDCSTGLNAESIWHVSWSGLAYPLPEIYLNSGVQAGQWRYLSRYAYDNHGVAFTFRGVLAQSGVCSQTGGCGTADNTPTQAWNQLTDELNQAIAALQIPVGPPTNIYQGPH